MQRRLTTALFSLLCATDAALAAEAEISGGVTGTAIVAEGGRASPVGGASLDLTLAMPAGPGTLVVYIEGNTAVLPGSVPAVFEGVDANAGTAQLNGSNGTVQISELKYRWEPSPVQTLTFGLLDSAAYLDRAATANDEKSQFLNAALVNNAAISFPDYAVGFAYERTFTGTRLFGLLTGSHGIGDTPRKSYGELFELDAEGKGLFAAGGLGHCWGVLSAEAGLWGNTADHPSLDGRYPRSRNYGIYGLLGGAWNGAGFDLRAGYANPAVTAESVFVSASLGFDLDGATVGMGYALTRLAPDARADGLGDAAVTEFYLRVPVAPVEATLDLQYLENPGFDATLPASRVAGLRLRYVF